MSREYKDLILWLIENTEPTYDGTFISNVELKEIILSDLKQYNDDKRLLNVLGFILRFIYGDKLYIGKGGGGKPIYNLICNC